jgi:UDP-N-acetylglucosamine:LPS N-acetylglucosamine transferase
MKLFLVATSGGHLSEILELFGDLENMQKIIFTEETVRLATIPHKSYSYKRPRSQILTMIISGLKAGYIILKERPDWVISTGAECGTAAIIAAAFLFKKTIFVETASRYRTKTIAARICYPLVDKFYVQHEEALALYGKKAEYIGGVL